VVKSGSIPNALVQKYGIENLYVEDLPSFWRLLYTIVKRAGQRTIVVIEIVDDQTYDKWFARRRGR
jgi:hypothetical protein